MPNDSTVAASSAGGTSALASNEQAKQAELTEEKREEALKRLLAMEQTLKAEVTAGAAGDASTDMNKLMGMGGGSELGKGEVAPTSEEMALKLDELKTLMESNMKLDPNMSAGERQATDAAFDKLVSSLSFHWNYFHVYDH